MKKFEKWLDLTIRFKSADEDKFENKVDLLERMIELARFCKSYTNNKIMLRQMKDIELDFLENGVIRAVPGKNRDFLFLTEDPIKPENLQILLLIFLLINDKPQRSVYSLIEKFILEIRSYLSPLDFERGRAGAVRCFTNTRFAANTLRAYGLLRFTQREAYKTWQLSFLGLLVASFLYDSYWRSKVVWNLHNYKNGPKKLSKTLLEVFDIICDSVALEMALKNIDKKQTIKLEFSEKEFNEMLLRVRRYSESIFNKEAQEKGKKDKVLLIMKEIEQIPTINKFLNEFKSTFEAKDFSSVIWRYIRQRVSA